MYYKNILPAAALGALVTLPTLANDKLEEIIVTSSRVEMPLRQVGTSVSVLNGEDIRALGFNSMLDVLRTMPAVGVSNTGGAGKVSTLRIRGADGYRTLLLIDGIDVSDTSSPQFLPRMEQVLSSGIGRVEVLRGPQGLMYGADSGGVVSMTTTQAGDGFGGDISAEGGRYGTRQYAASVGYGGDSIDGNLSLTDYDTDGFNARTDDTSLRDDDGYGNTTVHGRLGWNATDSLRLELVGRDVDGESEYDNCFNSSFLPTNNCTSEYQQQAWRGGIRHQGERFANELAYSESDTENRDYSDGGFAFGGEGKLEKWSYLGSFAASDATRLVYGADWRTDTRDDSGGRQQRDQDGYYLEYQGDLSNRFFVTAGARYDDNEDFGDYTTWRVSGAYLIPASSGEIKLRGTYGTGFRAPSLYEIGYNAGDFGNGVTLDAEESEGYDLAISWFGNNGLYLEAVYFEQTLDKPIFFDLVNFSGYLQGGGEAESSGVELIAEWPLLPGLALTGNYTYNDAETSDGDVAARRPEHLANLGLTWQGLEDRLKLGVHARLARDANETDGEPLDDYEVINFNASFTLFQSLELFGRVENLLDEDYQEVRGFNTSGAAAYAGVRYSF
ncbi:TonB-dependent receptor [Pseudohalioglobus sediminis]|uniref:TonB-dependent receptor n=1 Tax=Pseudohalioglobus sediminis TaxID=2606449 RepID=A0A5B0X4F8_9GAMM|nr:TonB-dependent receptor [Pseudohalioglobus sediminis]KAA1194133.1 TonB-dependent receptor [Pseudohalioglobus sediminis]